MVRAHHILFASYAVAVVYGAEERAALNPIRKVVNLLQNMQQKIQDEGAREAELFKKFDCYCKTGRGDLAGSIGAAEDKIPAVSSDIEGAEAKLDGAKSTLKKAQADRSAAKTAMAEATSLRGKEAKTFAEFKADHDANIAAIAKAVAAIEKGAAGGFLQTPAAQLVQRAVSKVNLGESSQEEVFAFLSQRAGYVPQSGEITGILKQMGDTMAASLADGTATEEDAIASYNGLMAAKKKEVAVLTATIESKTQQIGELGVAIVEMKEDLSDTQAALAADKKFLAELEKGCSTKAAEWEERSKTRAAELLALADTIKVLNDDDALELFKKTLPSASASLLQVQQGVSAVRAKALAVLRSAKMSAASADRPGLELLVLALSGKDHSSGGFGKVLKMIDEMVALLGKEQQEDEDKKAHCAEQLDVTDDQKKALENKVSDEEAAMEAAKEAIATLTKELAALEAGIQALDKAVADATAQRKAENAEFKDLIASDTAAQELLGHAKNRLYKFYDPKLYKPPAQVELSAEDRIYSNQGGELVTAAPGGIAGTGITVLAQVSMHSQLQDAPAPPPETWGAYSTKSQEKNGVIAMIDLLIKDLQKEITEAETQEKDDQAEYEQMMKESAAKRTSDSQSLTEKGETKAHTEAALQAHTEARAEGAAELMATMKVIASLHAECDWLLQYYEARKEARSGEVESLKRAKAVLSGADYSLLQTTKSHAFLGRA